MREVDLTGKQFGELLALAKVAGGRITLNGIRTRTRIKYKCRCSCGKELDVYATNLQKGNSTSCGCKYINSIKYNFIDLTGKIFGELIVKSLSEAKTKTRGALWNCLCSCGAEVQISSNGLTSGNNVACGNIDIHRRSDRVGEIPLSHINAIKQNAIKRNFTFSVDPQFLWDLFLNQNRCCDLSGVPLQFTEERNASLTRNITTASLDRIDNNRGYEPNNVRWIHKDLNRMRWVCSDSTFLDWCKKCIEHNQRKIGIPDWDQWFFDQCDVIKRRSKDKHTQCACIITTLDHRVLSQGYNSFPSKIDDSNPERYERDLKYSYMVHSEENAIYSAARLGHSLKNSKIYVTGMPCMTCARAIIQAGIVEVIYNIKQHQVVLANSPRYGPDFERVQVLLAEAGVKLTAWLQ